MNGKNVVLTNPPPISPGTEIRKIEAITENEIQGLSSVNLRTGA